MQSRGVAVFVTVATLSALAASVAHAQSKPVDGDAAVGRAFALEACTSCHRVAADQPFVPIYKGTPRPPDFKYIANKPNVSAAWLRDFLTSLPAIPTDKRMANADLTEQETRDVAAFIMTLRDQSPLSSR